MIDEHRVANQWVHWVIVDLPPQTTSLADNATGSLPAPARELRNAYGDEGYGGPTPPPGSGDHPYVITVYALDTTSTDIKDKPSRSQIERAVEGHVLASGTITGYFGR
jgi:Raf kinase inhibitor-like YbhB/YbcL family protein